MADAVVAADQGMDDGVQPLQLVRLAEHGLTQGLAVDAPLLHNAGKGRAHRVHRRAAQVIEVVHRGVGVIDRHAGLAEHRGGGRLAHADGAGQADQDHWPSAFRASARTSRSVGGDSPKKASKDGRAWPISMARPSTLGRPSAQASAKNGVTSGL